MAAGAFFSALALSAVRTVVEQKTLDWLDSLPAKKIAEERLMKGLEESHRKRRSEIVDSVYDSAVSTVSAVSSGYKAFVDAASKSINEPVSLPQVVGSPYIYRYRRRRKGLRALFISRFKRVYYPRFRRRFRRSRLKYGVL